MHGVLRLPEVIEGNRVITATTLRKIYLQRQDQSTVQCEHLYNKAKHEH